MPSMTEAVVVFHWKQRRRWKHLRCRAVGSTLAGAVAVFLLEINVLVLYKWNDQNIKLRPLSLSVCVL